jgi:hypothetical protein
LGQRAAIHARVSTADPSCERPLRDLGLGKNAIAAIVGRVRVKAVSGTGAAACIGPFDMACFHRAGATA